MSQADIQFRHFKTQSNVQSDNRAAQATLQSFYQCGNDTKINCVISGPMQKQMGGDSEACQIKVNVDFINSSFTQSDSELNSLLLNQFPQVKEQLEQACANMPSQAAADHERESRVKFLTQGVIQQTLQRILQSIVLGNEGTQILFDFTVIDCDQDLLQALVNSAAGALLGSQFKIKCVPTAITILVKQGGDKFVVDPTIEVISQMRQTFTHKLFAVMDSQKQEFIYQSLTPLSWNQGQEADNEDALDLEAIEKIMGLAQSCSSSIHDFLIEQSD